jgi:hypothetical protein
MGSSAEPAPDLGIDLPLVLEGPGEDDELLVVPRDVAPQAVQPLIGTRRCLTIMLGRRIGALTVRVTDGREGSGPIVGLAAGGRLSAHTCTVPERWRQPLGLGHDQLDSRRRQVALGLQGRPEDRNP